MELSRAVSLRCSETSTKMSISGFAESPGTAVLPYMINRSNLSAEAARNPLFFCKEHRRPATVIISRFCSSETPLVLRENRRNAEDRFLWSPGGDIFPSFSSFRALPRYPRRTALFSVGGVLPTRHFWLRRSNLVWTEVTMET